MLDRNEVAFALQVVGKQPAGLYTVCDLFGDAWPVDHRPRR